MTKRAPLSFTNNKVAPSSVMPINKTSLPANEQSPIRESKQTEKQSTKETSNQENAQTLQQTNKDTKKGRAGRQFIAAHVLPEGAKQFKLLGVQSDKTTQELLIEAINDLFAKYGLSRIAD